MRRRDFLRFLLAAPIAAHLDVEKLLWIPGEKAIFIPKGILTTSQIVAIELERVLPYVRDLFERDSIFYTDIEKFSYDVETNRALRVPLTRSDEQ